MQVSVIIPTYDRAGLVGEAVVSVLSQSFADLELIVVDDGSSDATLELLATFDDPRLQVIAIPHQGIAGAWAAGYARARGQAVITLGSDDRWLPHCLARLVAAAEARPDAVLVYGRARAMDARGRSLARMTGAPEPYPGRTMLSILYGDFVAGITALVRKDALDRAGSLDPGLCGAEDWDLWVRLASLGPFAFVDEVLAEFRVHPGRSTAPAADRLGPLLASRRRVLEKAWAMPDLPVEVLSARPLIERNMHVDAAVRWVRAGSPARAAQELGLALRAGPHPLGTLGRMAAHTAFAALAPRSRLANTISDTVARRRRTQRLG